VPQVRFSLFVTKQGIKKYSEKKRRERKHRKPVWVGESKIFLSLVGKWIEAFATTEMTKRQVPKSIL